MSWTNDPQKYLPHRPPALLLEKVDYCGHGSPKSYFIPQADCHYLTKNHLTEAGLVEAMAQAMAVHLAFTKGLQQEGESGMLVGIEDLSIRFFPHVGQKVCICCKTLEQYGSSFWARVELFVVHDLCAAGTIKVYLPRFEEKA